MAQSEERKAPDRKKVAEQIAASLRETIVGGGLGPGDALPSERELASKFEVNRSSVREALLKLEAWGLIEIRHGGATRVRELVSAGLQILPFLLTTRGRVNRAILRDVHQLRSMFLGWCAEQAAIEADARDVERFEKALAAIDEAKGRPKELQRLDWAFFEALVAITGNRVLALIANVMGEVYERNAAVFLPLYEEGVFDPTHHAQAVAAIRARDAAAAGAAMRAHAATALRTVEREG